MKEIIPVDRIQQCIYLIRGQSVMLGMHLAELYGVETRALNQAVKRNSARFPKDFAFRLTDGEAEWLVSQNVIPHRKYLGGSPPYAFTEQGVAMLSSVLNSPRAILVNIGIMRAFVRLRQILATHADLARKLEEMEQRYDRKFHVVFEAIRELMKPPEPRRRQIGFHARESRAAYSTLREKPARDERRRPQQPRRRR